jgi:hypothetical protein
MEIESHPQQAYPCLVGDRADAGLMCLPIVVRAYLTEDEYARYQKTKKLHVAVTLPEEHPDAAQGFTQREHLAWLMYCYQQGYTNPADRAILTNWMRDDPATLHPDDVPLQRSLLGMADEILAQVKGIVP